MMLKVRKKEKIRNRYSQVPHLTQNTIWESEKAQEHITNISLFLAGHHKATRKQTRQYGRQTRNKNNKKHPQ